MLVSPSSRVHGIGASKVLKLVVDLEGIGVGLTLVLPSVHGMGPSKVRKLVVDLEEVGVGPILVLPSVHGMDASKYYYCITSWCSFTNELVWFGIKTVGVPLSYYWHTLGCAIKPLLAHPRVCR